MAGDEADKPFQSAYDFLLQMTSNLTEEEKLLWWSVILNSTCHLGVLLMYLLDTNVISEIRKIEKGKANKGVTD